MPIIKSRPLAYILAVVFMAGALVFLFTRPNFQAFWREEVLGPPTESFIQDMEVAKKTMWEHVRDDSDFEKMGEPKEGEWLARFREYGQTVEQYKEMVQNRKTDERFIVYIAPLGKQTIEFENILNALREYCEIFFGCQAVMCEYQPMPKSTYNEKRDQYNANGILALLENAVPDNAVALAGFTNDDLYVPELNFVFGLGSLGERVGVFSIHRYGDDYQIKLLRALKLASHELGHVFSMAHCIYYKCNMNGANSLTEEDGQPMHLCPVCLEKICWANGMDPAERYKKLSAFYKKNDLAAESEFCARQAEKLSSAR
jgi:archaemetzincin